MQATVESNDGLISQIKPTERNLSLVFEGLNNRLGNSVKNILSELEKQRIINSKTIDQGQKMYTTGIFDGDTDDVDKHKKDLREIYTNNLTKLIERIDHSEVFKLSHISQAYSLRFDLNLVTLKGFENKVQEIYNSTKDNTWKYQIIIAMIREQNEISVFRDKIKDLIKNPEYKDMVFVETFSTPMDDDMFDKYLQYVAEAMVYQAKGKTKQSGDSNDLAQKVLKEWIEKVKNNRLTVYKDRNEYGESIPRWYDIADPLKTFIKIRFPYLFDFEKGITGTQLKSDSPNYKTKPKSSSLRGINREAKLDNKDIDKTDFLRPVWNKENYWLSPELSGKSISIIKNRVESMIAHEFNSQNSGQIAVGSIYEMLVSEFGFAPCELYFFLFGFLLKEYCDGSYRSTDTITNYSGTLTPEKLSEMIDYHLKNHNKPSYIVKMTDSEKEFYRLTEKAWGVKENSCSSVAFAQNELSRKMESLLLPTWCLEYVDTDNVFYVVDKYISLVQQKDDGMHKVAMEIGAISSENCALSDKLSALLTAENCSKGMMKFLKTFENGKILELSVEIGAEDTLLVDIVNKFNVKKSCLWNRVDGEVVISTLLIDYGIVKESNSLLGTNSKSLYIAYQDWRDKLKTMPISHEILRATLTELESIFRVLYDVCKGTSVLSDNLKTFYHDLMKNRELIKDMFRSEKAIFIDVYSVYLDNLSDEDIDKLKLGLPNKMFELNKTDCFAEIKKSVDEFRKKQVSSKLSTLWRTNTGSKDPNAWSERHRTPILCCVPRDKRDSVEEVFNTLNRPHSNESEMKKALECLESADGQLLFKILNDEEKCTQAFIYHFMMEYIDFLPNVEKVREKLESTTIPTYKWYGSEEIREKIKQLAEGEYYAGGHEKILSKIRKMDDQKVKEYLCDQIKNNIILGMQIYKDSGDA
jgi:hypothetical protein